MTFRPTALLALPLLMLATVSQAAPLAPEACKALSSERDGLIAAGIKSDRERGPVWAKAHLAPERLAKIERLIRVEEDLSFRCGQPVTAAPRIKEPPQPAAKAAGSVVSAFGTIPPPKRKKPR